MSGSAYDLPPPLESAPPPPPVESPLAETYEKYPAATHVVGEKQSRIDNNDDAVPARAATGATAVDPSPKKKASIAVPSRQATGNNNDTPPPPGSVLKRLTTGLLTPDRPIRKVPGYARSWINIARSSYLNILLIFIPISWALHFTVEHNNPTAVFCCCFVAVIPLAALLGYTTEQLTLYTSQTIGGLLNATLGNVVELIVGIIGEFRKLLVMMSEAKQRKSSLEGRDRKENSIWAGTKAKRRERGDGGTRYAEQAFMATASQLNSSLLLFSVIAVLIPSAFHFSITTTTDGAGTSITTDQEKADILALSHGVAIILLLIYMGYLLFQFFTHADLFADRKGPTGSTRYPDEVTRRPGQLARKLRRKRPGNKRTGGENDLESEDSTSATSGYLPEADQPEVVEGGIGHAIAHVHGTSSAFQRNGEGMMVNRKGQVVRTSATRAEGEEPEEDDEEEEPELNWQSAIICMILISAVVGVTAEFLVGSINGLVETHPALSQEWVGLILLPIIGNAAEHLTALITAYKDKVDLALAVAVGSSIQIALFVIPIIVLIGWIIGKPLLMLFDPFESVVLFLSVIIVNQTLSDGKSNWMEGFLLFMVYIMVAVVFWYYPGSETANLIGQAGCS
ncbi:hypothetical protein QFC22_006411 [Naganishia vaughanmartiniae]|uniref:Uncharacterized protein n=1 Tax=Naganishia vaughanmartiniae TaxID=1424756 RepID=A0ACC2WMG7_9TREE|nr:hypothetical protein QFC22_006411 [Naganishia vaughanmartiniae]